jgi:hypothetical protein
MPKMTPHERDVHEAMKPGRLTRDGMLGTDGRSIEEIIAADAATLARLGVTREALVRRMRQVAEFARARLGDPALFEDRLEVRAVEDRGGIPCPFQHPGRFPKCIITARDAGAGAGEEVMWSALSTHLIEQHGFFEGTGSPFRVEPEVIVRILRVTPG